MAARFILSLDCEGKWGVADHLTHAHARDLSDAKLLEAYRSILHLLDEFQIPATFAFVGAFSQSAAGFRELRPALEAFRHFAPAYIGGALHDIDQRSGDGWHGDRLIQLVTGSRIEHEIALQGVTHVPWSNFAPESAEVEMALFRSLQGPIRQSRTFVFPRNLVAHTHVLERHGFDGFRKARSPRVRAVSLLSEFNLLEAPEFPDPSPGIMPIPAGFFLNWRHGLRQIVPQAVSRMRMRNLLRAASATRGVVHYWLHPENIATAPATLDLLRFLAAEVARARDDGHCDVVTQRDYCRWARMLA